MAESAGRIGTLELSSDGNTWTGTGYGALSSITSLSWSLSVDTADTTNFDDAGYKDQIVVQKQATLGVECIYDKSATQGTIETAVFAGTKLYYRYRPQGAGSGLRQYVFAGTIGNLDFENANDNACPFSFEVTSAGTITASNQ